MDKITELPKIIIVFSLCLTHASSMKKQEEKEEEMLRDQKSTKTSINA